MSDEAFPSSAPANFLFNEHFDVPNGHVHVVLMPTRKGAVRWYVAGYQYRPAASGKHLEFESRTIAGGKVGSLSEALAVAERTARRVPGIVIPPGAFAPRPNFFMQAQLSPEVSAVFRAAKRGGVSDAVAAAMTRSARALSQGRPLSESAAREVVQESRMGLEASSLGEQAWTRELTGLRPNWPWSKPKPKPAPEPAPQRALPAPQRALPAPQRQPSRGEPIGGAAKAAIYHRTDGAFMVYIFHESGYKLSKVLDSQQEADDWIKTKARLYGWHVTRILRANRSRHNGKSDKVDGLQKAVNRLADVIEAHNRGECSAADMDQALADVARESAEGDDDGTPWWYGGEGHLRGPQPKSN